MGLEVAVVVNCSSCNIDTAGNHEYLCPNNPEVIMRPLGAEYVDKMFIERLRKYLVFQRLPW